MQADLPYDYDLQSNALHEILNTHLQVETGLEVKGRQLYRLKFMVCIFVHAVVFC